MRTPIAIALSALLLASACKKGESQSFKAGIEAMCNAYESVDAKRFPVAVREQRIAEWLDDNVKNKRARELLEASAVRDAKSIAAIRVAANEVGLKECPLLYQEAAETELPANRLPVAEGAKMTTDIPLTRVVVDKRGIHLGGELVVTLTDWKIDDDDMDGNVIVPLKQALRDNALMVGSVSRIGLLVDREAPFSILVDVISSAKRLGMTDQLLIVAGEAELGALEIYLPSAKKAVDGDGGTPTPPDDEDERIKMVVTVGRTSLRLWSLSGTEGTLEKPRLTLEPVNDRPSYDLLGLTNAVLEVVVRHWPGRKNRPPESNDIAVMVDSDVPVQTVVDVLVAVRYDEDGRELFPRTLLATSFDAAPPE